MKKIFTALFVAIMVALSLSGLAACDSGTEKHYNFVITNATIPPVMATMSLWDSEDTTYLWYGRADTFMNVDKLEERFNLVADAGEEQFVGISTTAISQMANQVESIYRKNKKSTFTLYVVDYGIRAPMKIFYEKRIPESNFEVVLLEDGTGSYNIINPMVQQGEENFLSLIDEVDNMIAKSKNGTYVFADVENMDAYWNHTIAYATKDNVKLMLQYPELIESTPEMEKYLYNGSADNKINFVKKTLRQAFGALSQENQKSYREMMFDTEMFDEYFIEDEKPILVVTGTSFGGEKLGFELGSASAEFEVVMDKILEMYGDEYQIVYKGHPSWPVVGSYGDSIRWQTHDNATEQDFNARKAYFEAHPEIIVAPAQSPMDVIMICYPGLYVGGYNSSLYMSAFEKEIGQVKFFITADNKLGGLSAVIQQLFNSDFFKSELDNTNPIFLCPEYFAAE